MPVDCVSRNQTSSALPIRPFWQPEEHRCQRRDHNPVARDTGPGSYAATGCGAASRHQAAWHQNFSVGARVVESGPDGENLAAGAWQRLEALPDPRSPRGRVYPLACLVPVAVCAFTAAGNDWFTAVGQWVRRAGQADLARLRAPWDPLAGRYRAPDEKTIRVVLDRVDPRTLARAGPARRPGSWLAAGGQRARLPRPADRRQAKALARGRLRTVAVDGKTSACAARSPGRVLAFLLAGGAGPAGRAGGAAQEDIGQSLASTCRKSFSLTRGSFHGGCHPPDRMQQPVKHGSPCSASSGRAVSRALTRERGRPRF